ncbi:PQQ-dependent sugar dehydrogenase [Phytomonospora endophytica]|uniref:Glucose/arabinose dehydrogenase n=1 Tax=Phytomonospora endophytica TaxID=714109 RepID=A0A841FMY1_9ACTN|nr:PQQ-dependent sugar dehydrogenase [Phytomonospora endophytica]MBB6034577.1 glucose/arabinose dehydrogenase [Phytomonospora endophytica]
MTSRPVRSRVLRAAAVLAAASLLSACAFGDPPPNDPGEPPNLPQPSQSEGQESAVAEIVADNLEVPWGIAFLPDGTALFTERDTAKIRSIGTDGAVSDVQTVDEAEPAGEGGLLGIAVSPKYAEDELVFIYYTAADDNRIARLKLGGTPEPIVTGIPKGSNHNGGGLGFGPDGFLYASAGETYHTELAQDKKSLGGKILRMKPDGKPAPGNPFDSLVYSYGHRNVQGFAWDEAKNMYAIEFGQDTWDELNLIEPGGNYGWPEVEGVGGDAKYVDPLVTWATGDASCSGAAITGNLLITSCLRGERLWLVTLDGEGGVTGEPQPVLEGQFGRLRAAVAAPDGSVWVSTSNKDGRGEPQAGDDKILRIVAGSSGIGKA